MVPGHLYHVQCHSGLSGKGPGSATVDTLQLLQRTCVPGISCAQRWQPACPCPLEADPKYSFGPMNPGIQCGHG